MVVDVKGSREVKHICTGPVVKICEIRLNSVLSSNFYKLHHGKGKLYILYFQIHCKQVNILFNASSQISMSVFITYCE